MPQDPALILPPVQTIGTWASTAVTTASHLIGNNPYTAAILGITVAALAALYQRRRQPPSR